MSVARLSQSYRSHFGIWRRLILGSDLPKRKESYVCLQLDCVRSVYPSVPLEKIIQTLDAIPPRIVNTKLSEQACRKKLSVSQYNVIDQPISHANRDNLYGFLSKIRQGLSEKKVPGIGLEANALIDIACIPCGHAMTVIGKRWNKKENRCELHLRNSWGPGCSGKRLGRVYKYRDFVKCVGDGTAWVRADAVFGATTRMQLVK